MPAILEILSCAIATLSGFLGLWFGLHSYDSNSIYLIVSSGLLSYCNFAYLNNWSKAYESAEKGKVDKTRNTIGKVLHALIYVIFALQITASALMVG